MAGTRISPPARRAPLHRNKQVWAGSALAVAVALAVGAVVWHPWARRASDPVYRTSTAQVTYQVTGTGTSPRIEFVNGPDNSTDMAMHAKLPWSKTLSLPVGLGGAVADMTAAYPDSGQPLTCRILVNGKVVREELSSDGYSDAACSTVVPAARKS